MAKQFGGDSDTDREIYAEIVKEMDKNSDGLITFKEFSAFMKTMAKWMALL